MVTIKTYSYLPEAFFDKSRIEDAGIIACIPDEQTATMGLGSGFQGVRLQVAVEDKEAAEKIIFTAAPNQLVTADNPAINDSTNKVSAWPYFLGGGIIMALGYAFLALLSVTTGDNPVLNPELIWKLFINGGVAGLVFRVLRIRYFPKTN